MLFHLKHKHTKVMTKKSALFIMFFILGIILIFHFLIFTEQIPYDIVWAGKLKSVEEMKTFETFSIILNAFMLAILFIKYKHVKKQVNNKVINFIIWIFVILFALNTVGNLFSQNMIELILGTFLTLVSSVLCFIIVRNKKHYD